MGVTLVFRLLRARLESKMTPGSGNPHAMKNPNTAIHRSRLGEGDVRAHVVFHPGVAVAPPVKLLSWQFSEVPYQVGKTRPPHADV